MILVTLGQQQQKKKQVSSNNLKQQRLYNNLQQRLICCTYYYYFIAAAFVLVTQVGILVATHSALNPSSTTTISSISTGSTSSSMPPKDGFRTVLSSSIINADNSLHQRHDSRTTITDVVSYDIELMSMTRSDSELRPLIVPSLPSTPRQQQQQGRKVPNNNNNNNASEKSPNKVRYGLFRRKLMEESSSSSSFRTNNNNGTTNQTQQQQQYITTTATAAATVVASTSTPNSTPTKLTSYIYNIFRGGAITPTPAVAPSDLSNGNVNSNNGFISSISSSSSSSSILSIAASTKIVVQSIFVNNFMKFANFVGYSKARCFCLLFISVLIESYATTLSKQAKDTGNALLFARACCVYIVCMIGFNISLAKIDVSVAYAVWSALGTTVVTAVGFFWFGESLDTSKILYLGMIVCGVVGLNLRDGGEH